MCNDGARIFNIFLDTDYLDQVVLGATKKNPWALAYATDELKGYREIVLEAGYSLKYASADLRRDHEIVLEAVKQSGEALEYASAELRGDRK